MPEIKEYYFTSQDRDSHAELDMLFTSKPETSIRVYFDGKIILEHIKDENKPSTP
jgi:ArsR family metal-binding transcriptional regulator